MKKVLLIDSGSGGVNILKECVKVCPHCDYLLFCDSENLPYGSKTKADLIELTQQNLDRIYSFFKFEIVVLACNTLTATVIDEMRERYKNITFVGTVPAIKPALEKFSAGEILILATEATIEHNKLINKTPNLILKAMPNLASDIDANLDNLDTLKYTLKNELKKVKDDIKSIVLGCTHYLSIKHILQDIFGQDVEIFDSANGVARRLKHFIGESEINYQVQFIANEKMLPLFWHHFSL